MKKTNELYESIVKGLNETIKDAKSNKKVLKRSKYTYMVVPIKQYKAKEIKEIRNKANMTQKIFALYMGVSLKTVEAWENGKNIPSGSSSRMLSMFEMNNNLANDYPFVIRSN